MEDWSGLVGLVVVVGIFAIDHRLNQILKELRKMTQTKKE